MASPTALQERPERKSTADADEGDRAVIAAVLKGDIARFAVLVQRYNQRLFRIGLAHLHRRERVEDAMQEAYVRAFQHLRQFAGNAAFSSWLSRIMINECLMQLRRMRRRDEVHRAIASDAITIASDDGQVERQVTVAERRALLEEAVARLPDAYRAVFLLREVQQLDTAETADLLELSVENVKVRLHRAREMLKRTLQDSPAGSELFTYGAERCQRLTATVLARVISLEVVRRTIMGLGAWGAAGLR